MAMKLSKTAQRAAKIVRFSPGITRRDLADHLGVSVTTVNPLVAQLIGFNVITEGETTDRENRIGRPRTALNFRGLSDTLAVVLWSHGVLDIALMTFAGTVAHRVRTPTAGYPSEGEITEAIEQLFTTAAADTEHNTPVAIVLGLPAPYERGVGVAGGPDPSGEPGQNGYSRWFSQDPLRLLADRFGVPVVVENDANLGALGESTHGVARGQRCVIYAKLSGNGIGAGITIDGRLLEGSHGFAGEIAHVRVDDTSTTICICGSRGCLEEKVGSAMLAPLHPTHGADFSYDDLLELIERDAPGPTRILLDAGRTVGRALADMSTYLNPGMIVLDAGSPTASELFIRGVSEQIEQSAPPFIRQHLVLRASALLDDAPMRGAVEIARTTSIGRPARGA